MSHNVLIFNPVVGYWFVKYHNQIQPTPYATRAEARTALLRLMFPGFRVTN